MKKKDWEKFKQKTDGELETSLVEEGAELVRLKMELAGGKLKDVHQVLKKRHDLAKIKTLIRQRQLQAAVGKKQEEGKKTEARKIQLKEGK